MNVFNFRWILIKLLLQVMAENPTLFWITHKAGFNGLEARVKTGTYPMRGPKWASFPEKGGIIYYPVQVMIKSKSLISKLIINEIVWSTFADLIFFNFSDGQILKNLAFGCLKLDRWMIMKMFKNQYYLMEPVRYVLSSYLYRQPEKKKWVPNFGTQRSAIWQRVGCLLFQALRAYALMRVWFSLQYPKETR